MQATHEYLAGIGNDAGRWMRCHFDGSSKLSETSYADELDKSARACDVGALNMGTVPQTPCRLPWYVGACKS